MTETAGKSSVRTGIWASMWRKPRLKQHQIFYLLNHWIRNEKPSRRSRFSFIRFTFPCSCIFIRLRFFYILILNQYSVSLRRVIACNILIWYMCSSLQDTRGKYVCLLKLHRSVDQTSGMGKRSWGKEALFFFFYFGPFIDVLFFLFLLLLFCIWSWCEIHS